jgi:hypothetical protein
LPGALCDASEKYMLGSRLHDVHINVIILSEIESCMLLEAVSEVSGIPKQAVRLKVMLAAMRTDVF